MAYSQTKYWLTYSDWQEDWRYRLTWDDQKRRIFGFNAWRYDSNCFGLNWSHTLAGTLYYNFSRTNNPSVFESFLFTTACSMYWEYVVEWRNVHSSLFIRLPGTPVELQAFREGINRRHRIQDTYRKEYESRYFLGLNFRFQGTVKSLDFSKPMG